MNNILKSNQPKLHEQWNTGNRNQGNLSHRKTIQSQHQTIKELESKLEFKEICLRAALADLKRMDEKLLDAQDEFFNLGDAVMNRLVGVESPFQYE